MIFTLLNNYNKNESVLTATSSIICEIDRHKRMLVTCISKYLLKKHIILENKNSRKHITSITFEINHLLSLDQVHRALSTTKVKFKQIGSKTEKLS